MTRVNQHTTLGESDAGLSARGDPTSIGSRPLRVAYVLPSRWEGNISLMGGGDRYVCTLAAAMAAHVDVTLVTFGPRIAEGTLFGVRHLVLPGMGTNPDNPIPTPALGRLASFDLVHAYQFRSLVTSILAGLLRMAGTPLIVTDLGGGGRSLMNPARLYRLIPGFAALSAFSKSLLPVSVHQRCVVVKGGIELERFQFDAAARGRGVLQVGRIMPHKGMNYLVEAAGTDLDVTIAGRVIDRNYFRFLQEQAAGRRVRFVIDPTDDEVTELYRKAAVTVVASVYRDVFGVQHPTSELLGLPLLESMAVGTPVVCTRVGGMPEYMLDGKTGFIVTPNDPSTLRDRVLRLLDHPALAAEMGRAGHRHVQQYGWTQVAERTLAAYADLNLIRS